MSILWIPGTVLGVMILLFLYEATRLLLSHCLLKREERKLEKILKKSLDYLRSPEFQKLLKDTRKEMMDDDLYIDGS